MARDPNKEIARRQASMRRRESVRAFAVDDLIRRAGRAQEQAEGLGDQLVVFRIALDADPVWLSQEWPSMARNLAEDVKTIDFNFDLAFGDAGEGLGFVSELQARRDVDAAMSALLSVINTALQASSESVTLRIGYAFVDDENPDLTTALEAADLARAEASPEEPLMAFTPFMRIQRARSSDREVAIACAILEDGIRIRYQPIVDISTGQVTGVEALARLSVNGLQMLPGDFLPVLDRSNLLPTFGVKVAEAIGRDLELWRQYPNASPAEIWMNLSRVELLGAASAGLLEALQTLDVNRVGIEVSEEILCSENPPVVAAMDHFTSAGVAIAIDDFAAMRLPVGQIAQMNIARVKLDRGVIRSLPTRADDRRFITALVELFHSLGITVVAGGVETEDGLSSAIDIEVDAVQGYLLAQPLDAQAVANLRHAPSDDQAESDTEVIEPDPALNGA